MSLHPIYLYGQPVLRKKARTISRVDDEVRETASAMFETMRNAGGIGLAGNQIGYLRRLIVVDLSEMEDWRDTPPMVLINPEVVGEDGTWTMEEGCLSIPDVRDDVERAEEICVRFRDLEFAGKEITANGLLARVLLHEIDHLNGVLFVDRIGPGRLKLLRGRLNKIAQGEVEVRYPVVPASAHTPVVTP